MEKRQNSGQQFIFCVPEFALPDRLNQLFIPANLIIHIKSQYFLRMKEPAIYDMM